MYKVKQIAEMLNVETVLIHEKLIELRDRLAPHVVRKSSIIFVDYEGYQLIKESLVLKSTETQVDSITDNQTVAEGDIKTNRQADEMVMKVEDSCQQDIDSIHERINLLKQEINRIDLQIHREEEALTHYNAGLSHDVEILHQWLKRVQND